jgi:DNA-binding SARP family transcriptional activator
MLAEPRFSTTLPPRDGANTPRTIVHVATGTVTHEGAPVELSRRERTLATAIAVQSRPLRTEVLAQLLFPDRDDVDAAKTVKVYVYRIRQRVSADFIVRTRGGYAMGSHVVVDLRYGRLLQDRLARSDAPLNDAERDEALELARGLRSGPVEANSEMDWWDDIVQRAARLGRDLAMAIGTLALKTNDPSCASTIARELTDEDACDESAWELLIRAKLLEGDRREALRNLRDYEKALAAQLGAQPSPYLCNLVSAGAPDGR